MVIAANLKTNLTRIETKKYLDTLESFLKSENIEQKVIVFPAMTSLQEHKGKAIVGAQNAYATENGAFTGEIGLDHLKEFGINTILIGHSERRHILGESQESIVEKFNYYKELGFEIVYCIGEPLDVREAGEDAMLKYLDAQYTGIDTSYEKLIIAYEPVWAIGTGKVPTLQDIEQLHTKLKEKSSAPLLYGGSVKVSNAKEILALANVDGVLVGGAALYVDHFSTMCAYAQELQNK
jgi:triosephosphate isomerase (TIM)